MGNKPSKSTNIVDINTTTTIEKMTSTMSSTSQETYQSSFNVQVAKIINYGYVKGNVSIAQEINVVQQAKAQLTEEITRQMSEDIKSGISSDLDQKSSSKLGLFGGGASVSSANITKIKDAFNAVIKDEVTLEKVQKIVNDTVNTSKGEIYNYGVIIGDLKIDQKTIVRMTAINILNSVFNQVNKYLQDNKSNLKVQQSAKSESGMGEGSTIAMIIACIFLCICSMVLIVMLPKIIDSGSEAYATTQTGGASKMI